MSLPAPTITPQALQQPDAKPEAGVGGPQGLPALRIRHDHNWVLARLDEAARRGRLAGFRHGTNGVFFTTYAFSNPFDGELDARTGPAPEGETELRFAVRMQRKLLWVYTAVLLLSIWPGLPITRSLLASLFPSAHWLWGTTDYWYLPLAVIGAPWALYSALRRSRAGIAVSALEMVGKIEKELSASRTA